MGIVSQPWDPAESSFYNSLAIYHGFVAGLTVTAPSPLLLTAIAAAATARWADQHVNARHALWKDLFHQALTDVITGGPKSWDDAVALCIARTWFWTADSTTTGLIYGTFIDTLSPSTADLRSRRVWDFMQVSKTPESADDRSLQSPTPSSTSVSQSSLTGLPALSHHGSIPTSSLEPSPTFLISLAYFRER